MVIKDSIENIKEGTCRRYQHFRTAELTVHQRMSFIIIPTVRTSILQKPWLKIYSNYTFKQGVLSVCIPDLILDLNSPLQRVTALFGKQVSEVYFQERV